MGSNHGRCGSPACASPTLTRGRTTLQQPSTGYDWPVAPRITRRLSAVELPRSPFVRRDDARLGEDQAVRRCRRRAGGGHGRCCPSGSTVGSAAAGGGRGQPMSVAAAITLLDEVYAFRQPLGGGAGWLLLLHQAWKEVA